MTLLFICASLEPGKDGVGDYTLKLAVELEKLGWRIKIIALRDKYVAEVTEQKSIAGNELEYIRIPARLANHRRMKIAAAFVNRYQPDWISLQYVPYGFSDKGIPVLLANGLAGFGENYRWHIMVHEVFVGRGLGWKMDIVDYLQKYSLKKLCDRLDPVVHTSIPQYRSLLAQIGIQAELLPLFGNIDIAPVEAAKATTDPDKPKILEGIYFGITPERNRFYQFAAGLAKFCMEQKTPVHVKFCGRSGSKVDDFIAVIKSYCPSDLLTISQTGELPAEELSRLFSTADFGIARVPPQLIGKSGSAIAMLEHGLPLWIPLEGEPITCDTVFRAELCFSDLSGVMHQKRLPPKSSVTEVAEKLAGSLNQKARQ